MKCEQFHKALSKFQVGQVVYIYIAGRDASHRFMGVVAELHSDKGVKLAKYDRPTPFDGMWFHPRQCAVPKSSPVSQTPNDCDTPPRGQAD
jgi:hypothetical protein